MKGTEHFREAEDNLAAAAKTSHADMGTYFAARAQVHATLAAAVAVSNLVTVWGDIAAMMRADSEPAGAEPPRAEPLVTCNAAPADDGPERCHLAIGHDGLHEHEFGDGQIVSWSTPAEMAAVSPDHLLAVELVPESRRCGVPSAHGMSHCWCSIPEHHYPSADSIYESTATDMHMEMPR